MTPLDNSYSQWVAFPLKVHFLAILSLFGVLLFAWYEYTLLSTYPNVDEYHYAWAAERVAAGEDPYVGGRGKKGYLYPPLLAFVLAAIFKVGGEVGVLVVNRFLNMVGLALFGWFTAAWAKGDATQRWRDITLLLLLSPPVSMGVKFQNLTLFAAGASIVVLFFHKKYPFICGILLGLSIAVKPLVVPIMIVLFATFTRHGVIVSVVSSIVAALLTVPFPYFDSWFYKLERIKSHIADGSASIHRILHALDLHYLMTPVLFISFIFVFIISTKFAKDIHSVVAISLASSLFVTPVTWLHTYLLALPLIVMAWNIYFTKGLSFKYEFTLLSLATAASLLVEGITSFKFATLPPLLEVIGVLPNLFAPVILAWYVIYWNNKMANKRNSG